jgi:hypothetical protein
LAYLFLPSDILWGVLEEKLLIKYSNQKQRLQFERKRVEKFHYFCLKVPSDDNSTGSHSVTSDELTINNFTSFTTNAFLDLETKVYGDSWSIPYKRKCAFILFLEKRSVSYASKML